jgi:hypothetical protein
MENNAIYIFQQERGRTTTPRIKGTKEARKTTT